MNDITNSINMRDNKPSSIHSKTTIRRAHKSNVSPSFQHRSIKSTFSPTSLKPQIYKDTETREPSKYTQIFAHEQQILKNKKSRLDMLDNSQLTSFPLAPPPSSEKVTESLKSPEINAQEIPSSRPDSQLFEIDPIVLVEDYIKAKELGRRKLSVVDLKTSLKTYESMNPADLPEGPNYLTKAKSILSETISSHQSQLGTSQTSSLLLTKCSAEEEGSIATTDFYSAKTSQTLSSACSIHTNISNAPTLKLTDSHDMTLGEFTMPSASSSLKYCVICETPLYELSSLLTQDSQFSEFVCSNCTERYEMLSNLIDNFDHSISELRAIPEDASIDDIEELLNQPANKKSRNNVQHGFSSTLVSKLQNQLEYKGTTQRQQIDQKSAIWLLEAKKKLRWRWRISGLIPQFLKR
ncbi:unnamed protein product [Wickerhamomyces anomalus]